TRLPLIVSYAGPTGFTWKLMEDVGTTCACGLKNVTVEFAEVKQCQKILLYVEGIEHE
ncbi:unnamed protein product, partial [Allacma fusca]